MRDLVIEQLEKDMKAEIDRGDSRVVTVQMIQPVREGLKERLFELHSMASQFLTRPAVHYLQKVLAATNTVQAFMGQQDKPIVDMLSRVKEGWAIFSRDATGATDWQGRFLLCFSWKLRGSVWRHLRVRIR